MTQTPISKPKKPLATGINMSGERITLNLNRLGLFNIKRHDEVIFQSPRKVEAEVFFLNCF